MTDDDHVSSDRIIYFCNSISIPPNVQCICGPRRKTVRGQQEGDFRAESASAIPSTTTTQPPKNTDIYSLIYINFHSNIW